LREKFRGLSGAKVGAVFHAAAVSDYTFGKIWLRAATGELTELKSGKIATRAGTLLAELVPTPKVIAELRELFPAAKIFGWKFEVEGDRASVLRKAEQQIAECRTDACVANGRAYGAGFGVVTAPGQCAHCPDAAALFAELERWLG
jgi:phosphopantothenoylcysteine decarboxylase/phosphopantothenate--cysteine ligase